MLLKVLTRLSLQAENGIKKKGRKKMSEIIDIGVIGDFDEGSKMRQATNDALNHSANALSARLNIAWLPTMSLLDADIPQTLGKFTSIWASAGVYKCSDGAIKGIKYVREQNKPFFGT